ncbi:protein kinase [Streptomyces sp. NPDC051214]|uniref:protein kinase domain-containing protein n=1 Tax=Streptomyces sp. NPDC051214 TaxID=3155282 RepID=UPI0034370B4A
MSTQTPSHPVPVPKGYRVGCWEVGELIASGSFASVYTARRAASARPASTTRQASSAEGGTHGAPAEEWPEEVALKFLPTGTNTPRQLRHLQELAERETDLLRRLRRPRLIRMYEALTVNDPSQPQLDGATALVLERAEGSLDQLLKRSRSRRPGVKDGRAIAVPGGPALLSQISEGIAHLHHAGFVHGDLKPANVLLMADGSIRLADFSLAAELEGTHAYSPAFATLDCMPPELLWAEVDERGHRTRLTADIWAFGVLAHLVLTGSPPFPGATAAARRNAMLHYARGQEELRLSPQLPDAWRPIVTDCLAPNHAARAPHTAQALLRRVETAAGAARSPRLPRLKPRRGPRRALVGALTLAAAAGLVTSVALALRESAPQGYARCDVGDVCFFSQADGEGDMCAYYDYDDDWFGGIVTCDWAKDTSPQSYFNNGYAGDPLDDVQLYHQIGRKDRAACLHAGEKGSFPRDSLPVSSHEWVPAC